MALNHKDRNIQEKISPLEDKQYDTQMGWAKLSEQLNRSQQLNSQEFKSKPITVWKMAAAAMILLVAGFFTGRFTSSHPGHTSMPDNITTNSKTAIHTELAKNASANLTKTASIQKPTVRSTVKEITDNQQLISTSKKKKLNTKVKGYKKDLLIANRQLSPKYKIQNLEIKQSPIQSEIKPKLKDQYAQTRSGQSDVPNGSSPKQTIIHNTQQPITSLPVMSLAQVNEITTMDAVQSTYYHQATKKESIYKKLQRQQGASTILPFKIRL